MIVVHAVLPLDPNSRDEALDLIADVVAASQAEDGVFDYHATTDLADPNVVRIFERYEDADAFESHLGTEHFQRLNGTLPSLLAGEPQVTQFDVDSASDLNL